MVPPSFGRDLLTGRTPEVGVWLDGSNTNRAETVRSYAQGVLSAYLADLAMRETGETPSYYPASVEPRFRYNQAFRSQYAIPPGVLMMLLIMIPAMLTALGVVREKELGSIVNLYAAPAGRLEFLLGKQLPYVALAHDELCPPGADDAGSLRPGPAGQRAGIDPGRPGLRHGRHGLRARRLDLRALADRRDLREPPSSS